MEKKAAQKPTAGVVLRPDIQDTTAGSCWFVDRGKKAMDLRLKKIGQYRLPATC